MTDLRKLKNDPQQALPWVWLLSIRIPSTPESMLRICNHTRELPFGTDLDGEPLIWDPFPMAVGTTESDMEGSLPDVTITVGGMSREIMALLVAYGNLMDLPATLYLISVEHTDQEEAADSWPLTISGVEADVEEVRFACSSENLYEHEIPPKKANRDGCGVEYRSAKCGFIGDAGDTLGDCGRTFSECELRGAFQLANGLDIIHPGRIDAYRGIPHA